MRNHLRAVEARSYRNDEHEIRCIIAWRRREHPKWSQHASEYRVGEAA